MRPVWGLLALLAAARADVDCDNYTFTPSPVTDPAFFPYALLVVSTEPKPVSRPLAMGTLISERTVLSSTAKEYISRLILKWAVAGASLVDMPENLVGVPLYPVAKLVIHPKYNPNWQTSAYNMALLFLERSDPFLVPAWMPPKSHLAAVDKVVNVYWYQDHNLHRLVKYTMPWCPHLKEVRPKCRFFNRAAYLCLTTMMDGVPDDQIESPGPFPCAKDSHHYLMGGPVVAVRNEELLGMFLRIENEGSEYVDECRVPSWKTIYFAAVRLLKLPSPQIEEAHYNHRWMQKITKEFFETEEEGDITTAPTTVTTADVPCRHSSSTKKGRPFMYPDGASRLADGDGRRQVLSAVLVVVARFLGEF